MRNDRLIQHKQIEPFNMVNDLHYTHIQDEPAIEWEIKHNFGKEPSVICHKNENVFVGKIRHSIDLKTTFVQFKIALAGTADCN